MRNTFMTLVLGLSLTGIAAGPSMAAQSAAVQDNMHHQQLGRAKKALENALVAIQDSGDWGAGNNSQKQAAARGIESAITEVDKEISRVEKGQHTSK
jgi:hypothetical protein